MNFSAVIAGLEFAWKHRKEIADGCEIGIHVFRRLEAMTHHHNVTVDKVLTVADEGLHAISGNPSSDDS